MTAQTLADMSVPRPQGTSQPDVPDPVHVPIPQELQDRDWIFTDPASYRAGVREALAWVTASPEHAQTVAMQAVLRAAQTARETTRPAPRPARTGS